MFLSQSFCRNLPFLRVQECTQRVQFSKQVAEKMVKAMWNGVTVAESDSCVVVDGNQYFPYDSLKSDYFKPSSTTSVCGWKGTASYMTIDVGGKSNTDAAWVYKEPKAGAANIANHVRDCFSEPTETLPSSM